MAIQVLILLGGLALVLVGADLLVDGASSMARKWGVSEFVIGLTIVAMGTSAPEMVVSFYAAMKGNADMAVGNIIGSNIFNTALILGISAMIRPLVITKSNRRRDIPVNILVTSLLMLMGLKYTIFGVGRDELGHWSGALLLLLFVWYLIESFRKDRQNKADANEPASGKTRPLIVALPMFVLGLAALIYGGKWFVGGAEQLARMAGLGDKFIAITVLAAGTSMPELATSVVAAYKGKGQLALGNVIGSNTFNILLILGGSALISPLGMENITLVDLGVLMWCAVVLFVFAFTCGKNRIDRQESFILLLTEVAYMTYLFMA